jgi:DNA polymerase-3 subunit beta
MKVTCSRAELKDALRVVSGVVDPRNIKPILKDIHVRTVNDLLELSATDLEVGLKYFVRDVEIADQGGVVIPGDPLLGIVNESRDEKMSLQVKNHSLEIKGAGSRFEIMGVAEEEFPTIPDFPEESCIEIEGSVLREMIEKTIFAVSVEKQRYALNGVLFVTKEKAARIEMVGTDGHRLALIRRKANSPAPYSTSSIISVKALQQVLKMLADEEIVKITVQERQVLVKTERGVLVAQLVEGRFPEYKEVIPDDCDKKLEIEAEELANAVRQAAVVTGREARQIWLKLDGKKLRVESQDPERGEAHVEVEAKYEGDALDIRFNPDFLLDGLRVMGKEVIRFEMKDPARAAVMRASADYVYLIMPIVQD